jgi:predicted alpha/beta-hydrolase family hydrolase
VGARGETDRMKITVRPGVSVTAMRAAAKGDAGWAFAYAPGAGSNVNDPFGKHLCEALAARGVTAVRFQFPYQEAGRSGPDKPEVIEATWRAVIDAVRGDAAKLAIGGRSMGGRIASMVHADGVACDALALFAYPLHPPGRPDKMRDEHLPSIKARTLFVSGTNDAFASPDELRAASSKVKRATVHLLEAADHGFNVKKASGRTKAEVYEEAADATIRWMKV